MIEDRIRAHALVSECMVVGDGRPFVGALITLDEVELENWAAENGHGGEPADRLVDDPALRAEIQFAVDDANRQVSQAEGVKKFVVP